MSKLLKFTAVRSHMPLLIRGKYNDCLALGSNLRGVEHCFFADTWREPCFAQENLYILIILVHLMDLIWFIGFNRISKKNIWLSLILHYSPIGIHILECFRSAKAYPQHVPPVDISFARHRAKHVFVSPRRMWRRKSRKKREISEKMEQHEEEEHVK